MISNADFEKLWFMYQTDAAPKGISINSFCQQKGVPYNEFDKWYKKTHRTVERVEISGIPVPDQPDPALAQSDKGGFSSKGDILVTIKKRDGLFIQKGGLDYAELRLLVERLEGLC